MNYFVLFLQRIKATFTQVIVLIFLISFFSICYGKTKYSEILDRKIFADTPPAPQRSVTSILKQSPLPSLESIISLKGVIYCPDGESKAIIGITDKKAEILCEEGDIIENAKILKINEAGVVFLYDDKEVLINLVKPQASSAGISVKDTPVKIVPSTPSLPVVPSVPSTVSGISVPKPEQPRDIKLNDIVEKFRSDPNLISAVSVTPYIQEGKVGGFVINRIPEASIIADIGIQAGDIIKRVNGVLIDSLGKAYAVYNNIVKSQSKIATVEILRNGQPLLLTYRLE